jgi:hypothetical protein
MNLNPIVELEFNSIQISIYVFEFNWSIQEFEFNSKFQISIKSELN